MPKRTAWETLQHQIVTCERCPRLREHCVNTAQVKRASFRDWDYWGRPLPNLGLPHGRVLIVGLAPAAHGGNRTGRMFTGDRSGDFLFRAMHEAGFANQPHSVHPEDGLRLIDCAITAVAHCAPPANKPTLDEVGNCASFLEETINLMPNLKVMIALGRIAFDACIRSYRLRRWLNDGPRPQFGHGSVYQPKFGPVLLGCFHPSQQNTFTGRLTPVMMRNVFEKARELTEVDASARIRSGSSLRSDTGV